MLSSFPRDVLDEIWNLIESVSEGFPTYSSTPFHVFEVRPVSQTLQAFYRSGSLLKRLHPPSVLKQIKKPYLGHVSLSPFKLNQCTGQSSQIISYKIRPATVTYFCTVDMIPSFRGLPCIFVYLSPRLF